MILLSQLYVRNLLRLENIKFSLYYVFGKCDIFQHCTPFGSESCQLTVTYHLVLLLLFFIKINFYSWCAEPLPIALARCPSYSLCQGDNSGLSLFDVLMLVSICRHFFFIRLKMRVSLALIFCNYFIHLYCLGFFFHITSNSVPVWWPFC